MAIRGQDPLVRKSVALNACAASVSAVDKRYKISRAHMSMLVEAVENEEARHDASKAMIEAIVNRYGMKRSHLAMLLDALRNFVLILQDCY